jgi:hypothetical protein
MMDYSKTNAEVGRKLMDDRERVQRLIRKARAGDEGAAKILLKRFHLKVQENKEFVPSEKKRPSGHWAIGPWQK